MTIQHIRHRLTLLGCAGLFAASGALDTAHAALFDDTEARQRIEATNVRLGEMRRQLEERIAALEQQIKNQGLVDVFNQVEQLKGDMARLRGQLEVITYELGEAQKRQRDLYVDIDSRMRRLESAGAAAAARAAAAPSAADAPNVSGGGSMGSTNPGAGGGNASAGVFAAPGGTPSGTPSGSGISGAMEAPGAGVVSAPRGPSTADANTEQRAYDAALDQFKSGNYSAAIGGFVTFVRNYPRSPLAPSAQYWIGNAQFAQRDFRSAILSQRQLINGFPESQKVPDAMLNVASSQFELGDAAASRRTLEELIVRHPQSEAAAKARQRLAIR